MLFNKKASLEISIQAIVIIVLAMTILGLGLGFVKNLFAGIGKTTEQVSEQVRQQLTDQLISGDRKVAFPTTEVTIQKGGSEIFPIGIRNKKPGTLDYNINFIAKSGPTPGSGGAQIEEFTDPTILDSWFQYSKQSSYSLAASETRIFIVKINVPTSVGAGDDPSGSYLITFRITSNSEVYEDKDFFINVRG